MAETLPYRVCGQCGLERRVIHFGHVDVYSLSIYILGKPCSYEIRFLPLLRTCDAIEWYCLRPSSFYSPLVRRVRGAHSAFLDAPSSNDVRLQSLLEL